MTMVPHPADADDILQQAKLVMWRSFSQFQSGTSFPAWARKIAFHQVLAFRKRRHRDPLLLSEEFMQAVADEVERSESRLELRARALHDCVEKLPPDHREVLHLRYHEFLSLEEMATRLERTVGALYRLLSRVRYMLHTCISRQLARHDNELT